MGVDGVAPVRQRAQWLPAASLALNLLLVLHLALWPSMLDILEALPLRGEAYDARQAVSRWANWGTGYSRQFDLHVQGNALAAAVAQANPEWRSNAIRITEAAYDEGGWPAANHAMDDLLVRSQPDVSWVIIHGDDATLVAAVHAEVSALDALSTTPSVCAAWLKGALPVGQVAQGRAERIALSRAMAAAYRSGARNLASWGERTPVMPPDARGIAARWAQVGPQISPAERWLEARASVLPKILNDALACSRRERADRKVLALSEPEAAWMTRVGWARNVVVGGTSTEGTY